MASFNIEIWNKLKEDFMSGRVYFGRAPEDTPAPYCVIHVMDSGDSEDNKTLCGASVYESDLQFNIYGLNDMQIDDLVQELNGIIKTYNLLENYRIVSSKRLRSKNASSFSAEVGAGFTEFYFSFEAL
jgi:hypothetical protein